MSLPPTLIRAMTAFPHSVEPGTPVADAVALMREHDVHHLPVVEGNRILGILTSAGLAAQIARAGPDENLVAGACCDTGICVVDLNDPLDTVLLAMADQRLDCAIVTRNGILAGVFTAVDACRAFGTYLAENFPHGDGDEAA